MKKPLRQILNAVIDYAGMFPPARLPLHDAIVSFANYLHDPDRWMLNRFICPAANLGELRGYAGAFDATDRRLRVSALGRGGGSPGEFERNLDADARDIQRFHDECGRFAVVEAFETRVPPDHDACVAGLTSMTRSLGLAGSVESTARPSAEPRLELIERLRGTGLGFKLRTGGEVAEAFPSPRFVAQAILACRDAGVPIKFTAGLHHPIRHFNDSVGTKMHGFINIYAGAVLASVHGLDEASLLRILEIEDASAFIFTDESLSCQGLSASVERIAAARAAFLQTFGSCSFDEPRDDLRALGWMR
jgi:hypothetical protein